MSQKQDLSLFADGSIIPETAFESHLFGLLSYKQGTNPSWLISLLIENSMYGTCSINHDSIKNKSFNRSDVIVISFLQDAHFYEKSLKKLGYDVAESDHFHFFDLFTDLFIKFPSVDSLINKFSKIVAEIKAIPNTKKIVFWEGAEFLLSSTNITPLQLLCQINKITLAASSTFLISSIDQELITVTHNDSNLPEFKTLDFLTRILHRSNIYLLLKPLETGRAKDITGTLKITKGTLPFQTSQVSEKEYLYFVTKDSTKLFFR